MLALIKTMLRLTTDAYDEELGLLIRAAADDLGVAGVIDVDSESTTDALTTRAIMTYVKMSFGDPEDAERLKKSYDEQKAQLATNTGHTDWRAV